MFELPGLSVCSLSKEEKNLKLSVKETIVIMMIMEKILLVLVRWKQMMTDQVKVMMLKRKLAISVIDKNIEAPM